MLSDDALDKLILPIAQRQENINNYIIGLIAKRIREFGEVNASDIQKIRRLMYIGGDMMKIEDALAEATHRSAEEIKGILYTAAEDLYHESKVFFEYRGLPFIPFKQNQSLQALVKAISNETAQSYINLSNTTGFVMRVNGTKQALSIRDTYIKIVDEAVQAVGSGVTDYSSEIRHSLRELVNSGVRSFGYDDNPNSAQYGRTFVTYAPESGRRYTKRLDSAVRQNVLDGVRAINQQLQDEVGRQFGSDGKEISVHRFPAPDHAPIQGHIFYNEEYEKLQNVEDFQDVDGRKFEGIERAIGMWNCRHFSFSIIVGVEPPNYTQKELDEILKKNDDGFDWNGKHYTMYECTQLQRKYELNIRRAKDAYIAAKTAGDSKLMRDYENSVNSYMGEYRAFSNACGLSVKLKNIYVDGYRP